MYLKPQCCDIETGWLRACWTPASRFLSQGNRQSDATRFPLSHCGIHTCTHPFRVDHAAYPITPISGDLIVYLGPMGYVPLLYLMFTKFTHEAYTLGNIYT